MKKPDLDLAAVLVLATALGFVLCSPGEGNLASAHGGYGPQASSVPADLQGLDGAWTVRVYFPNLDVADLLFISFEAHILGTNYEGGYHVMQLSEGDISRLAAAGLPVELDPSEWRVLPDRSIAPPAAQSEGIPGYGCYRTVEETYAAAQAIADQHPILATWTDQGDSWEKTAGLGGYDMMVLRLTNRAIPGPKPKLVITAAIHAREYATAELATRLAEYLVDHYGSDADITWILDYHEIHFLFQANPDGRKLAEAGYWWRKNTNQDYCAPTSGNRGADLDRNFRFQWGCCVGSSSDGCAETYRGPAPASEPEVQAIQDYLLAQFPDQRADGLHDAAPDSATGVYVDIHSYSGLVLWPWGFTGAPAGNATQLQTLGRKLAYWNGYRPRQAIGLYPTDGIGADFAYGELGVASFVLEVGTAFFEPCSTFEDTIVPANLPALLYAAKVARTPYVTPAGPDVVGLSIEPRSAPAGTPLTLRATVDDTRYGSSQGTEPAQGIVAAEYYVDTPPWASGSVPVGIALLPPDERLDSTVVDVQVQIDTTGWADGRHIIFLRGRDADGNWGAVSAVFADTQALFADADGPYECDEGGVVVLDASRSQDPAGGVLLYEWDLDGDGEYEDAVGIAPEMACGDDGSYTIGLRVTNESGERDTDGSSVTVHNVPPRVAAEPSAQVVQHSDRIATVTLTATDIAADTMVAATSWSVDGGEFAPGRPGGLALSDQGCTTSDGIRACTWALAGTAEVPSGAYTMRVAVTDDDGGTTALDITLVVDPEDAAIAFDRDNPAAVKASEPGGNSGPFSLKVHVREAQPDQPTAGAVPGDPSLARASVTLLPVGPGEPAAGTCRAGPREGSAYDAVLPVTCDLDQVEVGAYTVQVDAGGGYYEGRAEDVITVFDPSLGSATGGGWFDWPGNAGRASLSFTARYAQDGTSLRGNVVLICHPPGQPAYGIVSSTLDGLALGDAGDYRWATIGGKASSLGRRGRTAGDSLSFLIYVEDGDGGRADRLWIEVSDGDGEIIPALSMGGEATTGAARLAGGQVTVRYAATR